jgi:hypothetical protein
MNTNELEPRYRVIKSFELDSTDSLTDYVVCDESANKEVFRGSLNACFAWLGHCIV